jgi:hypothetical protein
VRVPDQGDLDRAISKYSHIDAVDGDPTTTLAQLVRACDEADQSDLVWLAILALEPLLDVHVAEIKDLFADALRHSPKVRAAYGASNLDIPTDIERFFDEIVEAHEAEGDA